MNLSGNKSVCKFWFGKLALTSIDWRVRLGRALRNLPMVNPGQNTQLLSRSEVLISSVGSHFIYIGNCSLAVKVS